MDKPISVGDLVMVVRGTPCCGNTSHAGFVFKVQWLGRADGCFSMSMVKRLDPDALKDDVPTKEELTV